MESLIRETILASVPRDGVPIGTQSLVRQVLEAEEAAGHVFTEEAIQAVREQLIAKGILGKGRDRGGSVYRRDGAKESAAPSLRGGDLPGAALPAGAARVLISPGVNDQYGSYQYPDKATLRPEVGLQDQFLQRRKPKLRVG